MGIGTLFNDDHRGKTLFALALVALVAGLVAYDRLRADAEYHAAVRAEIAAAQILCLESAWIAAAAPRAQARVVISLDAKTLGPEAVPPLRYLNYPVIREVPDRFAVGGTTGLYCTFADPRGRTLDGPARYYYSYDAGRWVDTPMGDRRPLLGE
jgi:hypothetical protein